MTIKSLTITEMAYDALKRLKHGDESFSDVIVRVSSERVGAAARYCGALKQSSEDLQKWKSAVKSRRAELDKELVARAKRFAQ